jgi:hypothetical protein
LAVEHIEIRKHRGTSDDLMGCIWGGLEEEQLIIGIQGEMPPKSSDIEGFWQATIAVIDPVN